MESKPKVEGKSLPYTTPSGFTYRMPTDWKSLESIMMNYLQAFLECWDEAECPPNPLEIPEVSKLTWNLLVQMKEKHVYCGGTNGNA